MKRSIPVHLGHAIGAGIIGSLIGTLITVAVIMPINMVLAGQSPVTIGAAPLVLMFSLYLTVPCAILIAAPAIWPLIGWAELHPWRAGLLYAALGGLAGALIAMGLLPTGGIAPLYGALFGSATGAAFIGVIRWSGRDATGLEAP